MRYLCRSESTCIFGTNDVICHAIWRHLSFRPYQFSIFDDVGGWQPCLRGSWPSQLLIKRVVSCTCDLSSVPTRVEMATWTKHDKDIDSPILIPRHIRAIQVRGRRLGNSPDKLNSWGHIRNCRGRLGTRLRFSIFFTPCYARQFQREQPQARILNGLEVLTSCLQMRVKYAVKLKRD